MEKGRSLFAIDSVWAVFVDPNQTCPAASRHAYVNFGRSTQQTVWVERLDCVT